MKIEFKIYIHIYVHTHIYIYICTVLFKTSQSSNQYVFRLATSHHRVFINTVCNLHLYSFSFCIKSYLMMALPLQDIQQSRPTNFLVNVYTNIV